MSKYHVVLTETLQKMIEVEANTKEEALEYATLLYDSMLVFMGDEDVVKVDYKAYDIPDQVKNLWGDRYAGNEL